MNPGTETFRKICLLKLELNHAPDRQVADIQEEINDLIYELSGLIGLPMQDTLRLVDKAYPEYIKILHEEWKNQKPEKPEKK